MALCWIVVQDEKYDKMREIEDHLIHLVRLFRGNQMARVLDVDPRSGPAIGDQTYTFDKSTTRIP